MKYDPKHNVLLYFTQNPCNPFHVPPHLLPFGQCIVEQTTLPLLNSLIVYCRVSSNFHFSLSIILFLVQKYWFIKKISRGGWSGFGKALVWIDPNCHENCLDWSKLFSSLSKLHPNRRCSVILPNINFDIQWWRKEDKLCKIKDKMLESLRLGASWRSKKSLTIPILNQGSHAFRLTYHSF